MLITCLGHAKFLLEMEGGMRIVTDPFDASTGYPIAPLSVDAVLVSHSHHDHSALDTLSSYTTLVNTPGSHTLAPDVRVSAVPAFHDDVQGAKRGGTLLFLIEAEGLRIAHLGDLGHLLTQEQLHRLAPVDVLMLPVGGHYTIDAAQARKVCLQLQPRVILPMHYKTACTATWPIAPVEDFTSLMDTKAETLDLLRVTRGDLMCQPSIAVLRAQCT